MTPNNEWKVGTDKSKNAAFEAMTRTLEQLLGINRLEISPVPSSSSIHVGIDRAPYKFDELGAGIGQLLIVLANVLVARPEVLLIDEPELGLHPALQLRFLEQLAAEPVAVLFSTHSIGLARRAAEHVYACRRDLDTARIEPLDACKRLSQLLGEMQFAAHEDVGYEGVLLVEGPTDVLTYRQWLRFYGLDGRIVILPLGGDSLIDEKRAQELSEVLRISNKVWCIVDREVGEKTKQRHKFKAAADALNVTTLVTTRRATENYLTTAAVQAVKGASVPYRALSESEALDDLAPEIRWGKNENWKIAAAMKKSELETTDIGTFLATIESELKATIGTQGDGAGASDVVTT